MPRPGGATSELTVANAPLTMLEAGAVVSLPLAEAPGFPGAIVVVDEAGGGAVADLGRSEIVATLAADGAWNAIAAAAAQAIARGTPAVDLIGLNSSLGPVEATVMPLADGRRAMVILRPLDFGNALHRSLAESRQRYKDLVDAISDFSWETDRDATFRFVSPKGALGWSAQEMVGQPVSHFVTSSDGTAQLPEAFRTRLKTQDDKVWFRRPLGARECLSVVAVPLFDATGQWQGSRGLCRRVTEQHRLDRDHAQQGLLSQLTAHLARTMQSEIDPERALGAALSAVGLAVSATGGVVLAQGDGDAVEIAGWGADNRDMIAAARRQIALGVAGEMVQDDHCLLMAPTGFQGARNGLLLVWRERDRGRFTADDRAILDRAADPFGAAIARFVDYQGTLRQSRTDPLTGLLNRRAFLEEAARRIARLRRAATSACLIFVDLDNFKLVNDRHGHSAGDEVLIEISRILGDHSRSSDIVARLGGDELVLWLDGIGYTTAVDRAAAIVARCRSLAHLSGDPARPVGASLGLAIFDPKTPETPEELILRADKAMYAVKHNGKGAFSVAGPEPGRP
jgi:diguanylate cyclase (GGDEF)-like protein/PAS domain S-box-containing protein